MNYENRLVTNLSFADNYSVVNLSGLSAKILGFFLVTTIILMGSVIPVMAQEASVAKKLVQLLPDSVSGLEQVESYGYMDNDHPKAEAMYGDMQRGMEVEVGGGDEKEIAELVKPLKDAQGQEGVFKKMHKGYPVYGGTRDGITFIVLPLKNGVISIEGSLSPDEMLGFIDGLSIEKIEALVTPKEVE